LLCLPFNRYFITFYSKYKQWCSRGQKLRARAWTFKAKAKALGSETEAMTLEGKARCVCTRASEADSKFTY
jgi:hypothetical protein